MDLNEQERADRKAITAEYTIIVASWLKAHMLWSSAYYGLGILLIICSAIAASAPQIGIPDHGPYFSLFVVILTGTIGLLSPEDRGTRYRQAWSLLKVQLSRFHHNEDSKLDDVIRAYEQGESIIHQTPAAQKTPQTRG